MRRLAVSETAGASPPEPRRSPGRFRIGLVQVAFGAVAGVIVLLVLLPYSGDDADPPTCYSVFGWVVPCEPLVVTLSVPLAGSATAAVLAAVLRVFPRRE